MAKAPSLAARLAAVAAQPTGAAFATSNSVAAEIAAQPEQPFQPPLAAEPRVQTYAPPSFALPSAAKPKARDGRVMVAGYSSPELSRSLRILAAERDVTIQHLVGEGLDFVLRHYGKHPMGER